jgi:hypothetical protein
MGTIAQSGQTTVTGTVTANATITGNIPIPSSTQTIINLSQTGNSAFQTMNDVTTGSSYTVPTGKTFYLFGASWTSGNYTCEVAANDGTTIRQKFYTETGGSPRIFSSVPIAVYTAGQVVKMKLNNASLYYAWGVEVTN